MGGVGSGSGNDPGVRTTQTGEGAGPSKQGGQRAAPVPGAGAERDTMARIYVGESNVLCGCGGTGLDTRRNGANKRPRVPRLNNQCLHPSIPSQIMRTGNLPMDIREVRLIDKQLRATTLSLSLPVPPTPTHPHTHTNTSQPPQKHSATWRSCLGSTAASAPWTLRRPRGAFIYWSYYGESSIPHTHCSCVC